MSVRQQIFRLLMTPRRSWVLLLFAGLLSSPLFGQNWYSSNWSCRKSITIDYSKVGSTGAPHTNFPVMISLNSDDDVSARARADGYDILFTSSDGTTKLSHELESYSNGTLVAWVRIPSLSAAANTIICMYYGYASASNQQSVAATWNSNYKGVWHLNGSYSDATSNANNGTNTGTVTATGKIANGAGFDASNGADYISVTGLLGSSANVTLSAWAYLTQVDAGGSEVISLGDHVAVRQSQSGSSVGASAFFYTGSAWTSISSATTYSAGWHYLTYTYTSGSQILYIDGASVASGTSYTAISYAGLAANTKIGTHGNGSTTYDFTGTLDEVRASNTSRSAGWILTEYNNQNSPSTFYSIGSEDMIATSGQTGTSVASLTWSHTVPNNSNRILLVGVQSENSTNAQPSSVTFNGSALTQIGATSALSSSLYQNVSLWYLLAPTATTANVVVSWGSTISSATAGSISLANIVQSAPEASATNYNNAGTTTTSITTLTDSAWVVDMFGTGQDQGDLAPGAGQTLKFINVVGATTSGGASTKIVVNPGATSMTWTQTGINRSAQVVAALTLAGYYSISGNVFEDVNYGGGAGRSKTTSSGVGRTSARVELYNSSGAFVTSTATDANGNYSFSNLRAKTYYVRVVASSVSSSRTGYTASCLPVLTYRTDASGGSASAVTNYVGGFDPTTADAANGAVGWTLTPATGAFSGSGSGKAHAFSQVTISTANVTGVDFGFNFNTIVNTNNSGQGSLRQFITNANALGNSGLAISGQSAGQDVSIFMIGDGQAHSGLRSGTSNLLTNGVAVITLGSALAYVTAANTTIDGGTQTTNVGNTSSGTLGTGSTVGTSGIALSTFARPEVELAGSGYALTLAANACEIKSIAHHNCGITVSGSSCFVQDNVIGMHADGTLTGSAYSAGYGVTIGAGSGANVIHNYIRVDNSGIRGDSPGASGIIEYNEVDVPSSGHSSELDAILLIGSATGYTVRYNLCKNQRGAGIEIGITGGVVTADIYENTITGNGYSSPGTPSGEPVGVSVAGLNAGTAVTFRNNIVTANSQTGVLIANGAIGFSLSQNSINNHSQLGIDLGGNLVSANNGTKNSGVANYDMDHPVLTSAILADATLTYSGYVGSAANQATFANAIVEFFESDGDASGYGEGQTYLGRDTCDANGNFSGSITVGGLSSGDRITGTATDGNNNTSEFGLNFSITVSYYSKGNLAVGTASNWNTKRNGSGTDASSFGSLDLWIIQNTHAMTLSGSSTWSVGASGTVQIESGGTWTNSSSGAVTMGTLQVDNGGSYAHGTNNALPGTSKSFGATSTVSYYGSNQTVEALTYGHLTIASAGTRTLGGNATVAGNLTISGGTFDLSSYTANRGSAGGTMTVSNGATLKIGGTGTIPSNYSAHSIGTTSTIEYSESNQTIASLNSSQNYGHLTLSGSGTKTPAAGLTIAGNFTLNSGPTFAAGSNTHVVQGNFSNSGTFTAGASTIQFTGSSDASITGATTFNTVILNKSASTNTLTLNNNVSTSTLTMTQGKIATGVNVIAVTSDRTGNGLIIGTITRTHTFNASTAYAFEGPYQTLTFNNGGTLPTSVTVTTTLSNSGANNYMEPIDRHYSITQIGGSGFSYTMRLHYEDSEIGAPNSESAPPLKIWRRTSTGPDVWTREGSTSNSTTNNWVEQTGLTDVGTFSLSSRTVANMELTLAQNAANPSPGQQVTYTISYSNTGDGTSTSTLVTAAAPSNTTYVANSTSINGTPKTDAADADEVTVSGSTISINLGTLAVGGSGSIVYRVSVN